MNVRLLLITIAVIAVIAPASYLWYRHRLGKTADALLARAEQLESEQNWSEATSYYQRSMLLNPDDTKTFVSMVEAYAKQEPTPGRIYRLNKLLYQALGRAPERDDLRQMLAENLLKSGEFAQAEQEAQKLLGKSTGDPQAEKVIALSLAARARVDGEISIPQAVKALVAAADKLPGDVQLVSVSASMLRENPTAVRLKDVESATFADQMMDRLVTSDPNNADALVARYRYRVQYKLPQTAVDLESALKIAPDHVDALLLSAGAALSQGDQPPQAESLLRRAIEAAPEDPRAYLGLARVLELKGDNAGAVDLLQRGRKSAGHSLELSLALVDAQMAVRDVTGAKQNLHDAETEFATYLAQLDATTRKRFENQLSLLRARLDLAEDKPLPAIEKLKAVLLASGADAENKRSLEWFQATQLLARISASSGQWDQAAGYWQTLVAARPGDVSIVGPAAAAYLAAGNPAQAVECLDACAGSRNQLAI